MALTLDTSLRIPATANETSAANPLAVDFTCGANAKALVVIVIYGGSTDRTGGSVTYNGVAMTDYLATVNATEVTSELWYKEDPPVGSAYSISIPNTNTRDIKAYAVSVNAAPGYTCSEDNGGGQAATSTNPYASGTYSAAGVFIVAGVGTGDNTFAPSAYTGTGLYLDDVGTWGTSAQYFVTTGAGATVLTWTEATEDDWASVCIGFAEVLAIKTSSKTGICGVCTGSFIRVPGLTRRNTGLI